MSASKYKETESTLIILITKEQKETYICIPKSQN